MPLIAAQAFFPFQPLTRPVAVNDYSRIFATAYTEDVLRTLGPSASM
jgi:hypothetical protein